MNWGVTCFFENIKDFKIVGKILPRTPVKYIELRGERPFFSPADTSSAEIDYFKKIIKAANLKVTMHSTFYDINLASINPYIQEAILKCYFRYLELGKSVGAKIMVLHGGLIHKDAAHIKKLVQISRNNLIQNLRQLGDFAFEKGIKIGLENSPPNKNSLFVSNWQEHVDILETVNHRNVGAVFDMAHAFLHKLDLGEYYHNIKKYLIEVHIHNNNGKEDQHLGITKGKIDYTSFFKMHRISVPIIMEIRNMEEALESILWIKEMES